MSIRTKILCLLGAMVLLFFCGLAALGAWDRRQFEASVSARLKRKTVAFESFLKRWDESLASFTRYMAHSTNMAIALHKNDLPILEQLLKEDVLEDARVDAVWVLGKDAKVVTALGDAKDGSAGALPGPEGALKQLLAQAPKGCHFYGRSVAGLLDVRGEVVRITPTSPVAGYLFTARWLKAKDLEEMARFTGDSVVLGQSPSLEPGVVRNYRGNAVYVHPLPGWDGRPISHLVVRTSEGLIKAHERSAKRLMLWPTLFALGILFIAAIALRKWVTQPLRLLGDSLRAESPEPLQRLADDETEMGALARLIRTFFAQRESLMRETRERQQAEEALQRREEHLRRSQKMEAVGQLAGGIAHDFNNALTTVMGYSELLQKHLSGDAVGVRQAEAIYRSAEQAATLTRRLLAFSRKQVLHPRPIDLHRLIADLKPKIEQVIGEHVEFRVRGDSTEAHLRADPDQIEHVILNLAANAKDAMPKGGVLTIQTETTILSSEMPIGTEILVPGRYVTLTVSDTGAGMRKEVMERIFEPFFTTKDSGAGAGLGLAMVYGIIKQSGGAISVESTPGFGASFRIHLPSLPPGTPVEEEGEVSNQPAGRGRQAVLVVEEDVVVGEVVKDALASAGYEVYHASTGAEALALVDAIRRPVGLLIADILMPQMPGAVLAAELRQANPQMKVLFISGNAPGREGISEGVQDAEVLGKPFAPHELMERVHGMLA